MFRPAMFVILTMVAALAGAAILAHPASAPVHAPTALAHPQASGAAGPFAKVTVTLKRTSSLPHAPFVGMMRVPDGRVLPLAGPDLPADFFRVDPTAVIFTPVDGTRANGIVILYDSSQIGPRHGTDHLALVYRITRAAATRMTPLEDQLEGVRNAAQARRRLQVSRR